MLVGREMTTCILILLEAKCIGVTYKQNEQWADFDMSTAFGD